MYTVELISTKDAKKFVEKNHYLKRWSGASYVFGMFDKEKLIGVVSFGRPFGRLVGQSISTKFTNYDVYELKRVCIAKNISLSKNKVNMFVEECINTLKIMDKKAKAVVTYTIPEKDVNYQVFNTNDSWMNQGKIAKKGRNYIHQINGEKLCDRTCAERYGTICEIQLRQIDITYKRKMLPPKERFVRILKENQFDKIFDSFKHTIIEK